MSPFTVGLVWTGGVLIAWTAAIVSAGDARDERRVDQAESPAVHVQAPPLAPRPLPAAPRATAPLVEAEEPAPPLLVSEQDQLAQRFTLESEDRGWTEDLAATLVAHFEASGIAEQALQRVECHATLCRVDVRLDSPAQLTELSRRFVELPASQVTVMSTEQNHDGTFASLMLTRRAD